MRNDTFDFVFSNAGAEEVRLDPQALAELARGLESMLTTILSASSSYKDDQSFKAYIVALYRGSAVVSFLIDLLPGLNNEIRTAPLGSLNNALDVVQRLASISLLVAIQLRLVKPDREDAVIPSDPEVTGKINTQILESEPVRRQVEALIQQAMRVGAEQVALRFPGEPQVNVSQEGSKDIRLVGASATSHPEFGTYDGNLRVGTDTLNVMFTSPAIDRDIKFYNGQALVNGTMIPVIVEWDSKRPVPQPLENDDYSDAVHVKGSLTPLNGLFDRPPSSREQVYYDGSKVIPISFRVAAARLVVTSQIVEE